MGTKKLFRNKSEDNELTDLFIEKNKVKPKKLFIEAPYRYMENIELSSMTPCNYYSTYLNVFDNLDELQKETEKVAMKALCELHENIVNDYSKHSRHPGQYIVFCNINNTIEEIHNMFRDCKNLQRIKIANFAMRTLIEDSFKYYNNLDCTADLSRYSKPKGWKKRFKRYNCGAHCNYKELVYSVERMRKDVEFCLDKIIE